MYRLIDHKQNILRPKGDQSFHTVWALSDSRYRVASPLIRPIGWLSLRRHPTGLM